MSSPSFRHHKHGNYRTWSTTLAFAATASWTLMILRCPLGSDGNARGKLWLSTSRHINRKSFPRQLSYKCHSCTSCMWNCYFITCLRCILSVQRSKPVKAAFLRLWITSSSAFCGSTVGIEGELTGSCIVADQGVVVNADSWKGGNTCAWKASCLH